MKNLFAFQFLLLSFALQAQIPTSVYTINPNINGKPHFIGGKLSLNSASIANKLYIEDNAIGGDSPDSRVFGAYKNTNNAGAVSHHFYVGNTGYLEIGYFGIDYGGSGTQLNSIYGNYSTIQARGGSMGLILRADASNIGDPKGSIKFLAGYGSFGGPERMRITGTGNIGIGTQNPLFKLQVENGSVQVANGNIRVQNGDVYVTDISKGIILKSPNSTCWRVTIDDLGNFQKNTVPCPTL